MGSSLKALRHEGLMPFWQHLPGGLPPAYTFPAPPRHTRTAKTAGAGYRISSAPEYQEFDAADPWLCPGPATHPAAASPSPGTPPVRFDASNQVILSWRAPAPSPADTNFGYKAS